MQRDFLFFIRDVVLVSLHGSRTYLLWMSLLATTALVGVLAFLYQARTGLQVTNMTDHVSWGAYIANFTFIVGLAAAAVTVVVPGYVYRNESLKRVVFIGECLAIAAVFMCFMFVTVDLGNPIRAWHLVPGIGSLNFPRSILSWDVVVLNVYFFLNLFLVFLSLFAKYRNKKKPRYLFYSVLAVSVVWAISIHTVTAFLYLGLAARPFWNSAVLAPRFLVSAFVSGPAFLIIAMQIVRRVTGYRIDNESIFSLRSMLAVTMLLDLFLFLVEVFKDFYSQTTHMASFVYLLFGLEGHNLITPYIWVALSMNILAAIVFVTPRFYKNLPLLSAACVFAFIGVWVEKGMALLVPGFVPDPLGRVVEYTPSLTEFFVSLGIWAAGMLVFSVALKVAIPMEAGVLSRKRSPWRAAAQRAGNRPPMPHVMVADIMKKARRDAMPQRKRFTAFRSLAEKTGAFLLPRGTLRPKDYRHYGGSDWPVKK